MTVASMTDGDFYSSEQSAVIQSAGDVAIELVKDDGGIEVLRPRVAVTEGEVIDASVMRCRALRSFYRAAIAD
ncbi:MAG TPA: hypothetical protein EYN15_05495, partial [Chromatiales bacterium]|nr:hypothetical protein [Chromatiales bacterium]